MRWTESRAPRIWRVSHGSIYGDEFARAGSELDDAALARVAAEGFTGIWLGGTLYELMQSTVFPELNLPGAEARRAGLRATIERAARHGLGLWLYFNEPGGVPADSPFWQSHPELRGAAKWHLNALCTSQPATLAFFREAVAGVIAALPGLAGVILITACENLTHCWSKCATRRGQPPTACPRCREREPADLVIELLTIWEEICARQPLPVRVLAWNWEWAYWYADPQREIVARLPGRVELLVDVELGAVRERDGRREEIGEYSLSLAAPGQRFLATCAEVGNRRPVHAKLQLNSTHELCTVPNIPVIPHLHNRFVALDEQGTAGFLGTWTIGCRLTLNTFGMRLYRQAPDRYRDANTFMRDLAAAYFGEVDTDAVVAAWHHFAAAFAHYPFSVSLLYFGPHNASPGLPLSLHYEGSRPTNSYSANPVGDNLGFCLRGHAVDPQALTVDEVIAAFAAVNDGWARGLIDYERALGGSDDSHCREELGVARMIWHQLTSVWHRFLFWREQQAVIRTHGLQPPCDLPATPALRHLLEAELDNTRRMLPLVEADSRLGFHEECQAYLYDAPTLRRKIALMEATLATGG